MTAIEHAASRARGSQHAHDAPMFRLRTTVLRRGRRAVLAPLDLAVPVGRIVALVGANGAGKSTLLMAAAGVLDASAGTAAPTIGGAPPASVGWVPQRPAFAPWLRLPAALALVGAPPVTLDVLLEPDAGDDARGALARRRADALSVGQVQALAVAAALRRHDPLVVLDEPFAGVDLVRRARLRAMIAERRRRRPDDVVVLSSHVAADLDQLCDWVVALRDGRVTFAGDRARLGMLRGAAFERRLASLT